jgi:hypothetical protein
MTTQSFLEILMDIYWIKFVFLLRKLVDYVFEDHEELADFADPITGILMEMLSASTSAQVWFKPIHKF